MCSETVCQRREGGYGNILSSVSSSTRPFKVTIVTIEHRWFKAALLRRAKGVASRNLRDSVASPSSLTGVVSWMSHCQHRLVARDEERRA